MVSRARRLVHWLRVLLRRLFGSFPKLAWLWIFRGRSEFERSLGQVLARTAADLGPAATKLAQIAGSRNDLLPATLTAPLAQLQDRVPFGHSASLRRVLTAAYDVPLAKVFEDVEPEPIAAGSIAVVFRGRTRGDGLVAIKVVRPGIPRQVEDDLAILGGIVSLLARLRRFQHLRLDELCQLFEKQIRRQCDMQSEAAWLTKMQACIGSSILVPALLPELTRSHVLVTRFIQDSVRISDPCIDSVVYESACLTLLRALYSMIFVHGAVHLDLHPGNVHVSETGRVVLFDYGLIAVLDAAERRTFRDFMVAVGSGNAAAATRYLLDAASPPPTTLDRSRLHSDVEALIHVYHGQRAGSFLVVRFVRDLADIQRRHGLFVMPGFANASWALLLYEGLVRERFPKLDFQSELRPYARGKLMDQLRAAQWAPTSLPISAASSD